MLSGVDSSGYKAKLDDEVLRSKTERVAPTGSHIKSGTKTSGTTTNGDHFSFTSFGGKIASSSGIDFSTTKGPQTQSGGKYGVSGTGNQLGLANDRPDGNKNNEELNKRKNKGASINVNNATLKKGIKKLKRQLSRARTKGRKYLEKYCKNNQCNGFTTEDIKNIVFEWARNNFFGNQNQKSEFLRKTQVQRDVSGNVSKVILYAGALFISSNGGITANAILPTILHEFYHTTSAGSQQFNRFKLDLQNRIITDPGYWYRSYEVNARKFADDVINENKK